MAIVGIVLRPLDVLLFRDARPFEPGDTGRTNWPTPGTFAGMIKTHVTHRFLSGQSARWHGHHGQSGHPPPWHVRLRFRGPWLYLDQPAELHRWNAAQGRAGEVAAGPLVPVPADVVRLGKSQTADVARLQPLPGADPIPGWSPPLPDMRPMWLPAAVPPGRTQPASGFLDAAGLQKYLAGQPLAASDILPTDYLAVREERTGIGIHPDRLTADQDRGAIYSASFWRLAPGVCFYGEVHVPDEDPPAPPLDELFPPRLTLAWGGEGRRIQLECTEPFRWSGLQPAVIERNLLNLLVTPGIFSSGGHRWKPRENGTLVAAVVPKPLPVSGWNLAGVRENDYQPGPRPTRFAVPAGAVYLWRRSERRFNGRAPASAAHRPPPLTSLCDKPADQDAGWGLCLSGTWNYSDL